MEAESSTRLVKQTFIEDLHTRQEVAKSDFAKLQKVDAVKQNQEKLQKRERQEKYMVFNYFWHHFPEVMATKDQNPNALCWEIGDSEFKKTLKAAKRFYGFKAYGSLTVLTLGFIGTNLGIAIGSASAALTSFAITLGIGCIFSVLTWSDYFNPGEFNLTVAEYDRREYMLNLYQNTRQKNE